MGVGGNEELVKEYNRSCGSRTCDTSSDDYVCGLISGGHIGLDGIPSQLLGTFSLLEALILRGSVTELEEAIKRNIVDVEGHVRLSGLWKAVGSSSREMIEYFLPHVPSETLMERIFWGSMLERGDLDTIYSIDQTRLIPFLPNLIHEMSLSPAALELIEHYYPFVSTVPGKIRQTSWASTSLAVMRVSQKLYHLK